MSDTFDEWWTAGDDATGSAKVDGNYESLPTAPNGSHIAKIVHAEVKDLAFKASERNKAGKSLVVKAAVNGYRPFEDIVPIQFRGIIEAICRSVGAELPAKGEQFDAFCQRLEGMSGPIETTQAVSANGREYVRVRWLKGIKPLPKEVEARAANPRPKPEKVDAFPDDIPF